MMSNKPVSSDASTDRIGASFEERSVWVQLLGLTMVLGGYFFVAWQMLSQGVTVLASYAAVFAVSVGMMVVVLVAGHAAVAIANGSNGRDERDRLIQWRAQSNSGWLLVTGVLAGITGMVLSLPNVWTAHLLLASLFVAEMLKLVLQLLYYRRGM